MASAAPTQSFARTQSLARPSPLLTGIAYFLSDTFCLLLAPVLGFSLWRSINPSVPNLLADFWPALALFWAVYALYGLYPGIGMTPVEELRLLVRGTAVVYLTFTAGIFLAKDIGIQSRGVFLVSALFSIVLVPCGRAAIARFFASSSRWGAPVAILGAGHTARLLIQTLRSNKGIGFRPVVCLDDDPAKHGICEGIPVAGPVCMAPDIARTFRIRIAIFAMPGLNRQRMLHVVEEHASTFRHVIMVPDLFGISSLWVTPCDLGGVLGLTLKNNLLVPFNRWLKRTQDVTIGGAAFVLALPVIAVAAVWIKLVSRGPAFYYQERDGKGETVICMPKLRTMHADADSVLADYLSGNPAARIEWERHCKLKNDPRIIPGIGRFLRRTSLDELPQLWCILKGEMSLVGPRPFPAYHNAMFDPDFRSLRCRVTPGLTGLWQISARSNGDLTVQAQIDTYYIKNWSTWLDLYILSRTVRAVLFPNGAY